MKFFRNYTAVLITLLFVIFCGAIYFFIYVPDNEKTLQERRFRMLQNIDENMHKKIENSVALMSNLLTAYIKDDSSKQYIEKYISNYSKENFVLTLPGVTGSKKNLQNGFTDSTYSITVNNNNRLITLMLQKQIVASNDTATYQMAMNLSFDQFVKFIFPENVFDQYLVFSNGELVYETFPSGIHYLNDSLLNKKNGIEVSSVRPLNISGKDYKLFSQPVSFTADKVWVITGLLSDKRYQAEKNQLPANGILLLVTIVFVIIVSFPWIKLYQMGSKDRLTVADGIASIAVSMLLISLLFFTFFKYNIDLRPNDSPNSKDTLAAQITTAFQNEIDTIYKKIHLIEDTVKAHPQLFRDIVNLNNDSISFKNNDKDAGLKSISEIVKGVNVSQVYWLDKNGDEKVNWISTGMNAPHGNFKNREYFKKIISKNEFLLDKNDAKKFYLDQVISWTSGSFTSVLSIPSSIPGQAMTGISVNLQSVHDPVLPLGYQFAIIDEKGNVLYHSDEAHNLNENLLDEFSSKETLLSNLEARTAGVFKTKYYSRDYNISIKPVNNLPYFIVIFGDISYRETRDTEIYSFTFSMMLIFFGFLLFELFVVFLVSSKRSFFKRQTYNTSWIGVKISSHHQYNIATIFNLFIILLVIIFFRLSTFLTYLYILLFSVTFISFFLTWLFARRYKNNNQTGNYKFKRTTMLWLLIFIFIIDVAALRTLDGSSIALLLGYELFTFLSGWIFFKYGDSILNAIRNTLSKKLLKKWNYKRSFTLMGLTRLIITSGIPIIFFYITSYNYEQNISIRYRQLKYASQLLHKSDSELPGNFKDDDHFAKGYYYDGAWIHDMYFTNDAKPVKYSTEEMNTAKFMGLFRINISNEAVKEEKFYTTNAADTSFFYNPLLKDACKKDNASITYIDIPESKKYLAVRAAGLNYKMPSIFSNSKFEGMLFWILLLCALAVAYVVIYNIINKLLCLRLPDLSLWNELDDKTIEIAGLNKLIFIIGLPGSGKLNIIKQKIKNGEIESEKGKLVYDENDQQKSNVFVADLINIPDDGDNRESDPEWIAFKSKAFDPKNKLIIVNHFEYNIQDAATNRLKLNFLEGLMLDNNSKIIILSTIHPVAFLDSVMDQHITGDEKSVPGQDLERWHVLLGHYRIIVFPLEKMKPAENIKWDAIYKETEETHFLIKIQQYAIEIAEKKNLKETAINGDKFAFKLQITAHYFYMYMWQSLTKEEKFLLYDLAEDNLVNSFDDYNLNMLLAKGVIIRPDGTLKLFNKGFRNFILTAIGNSEAMKIKKNIKDNGNWNKLKNPLLIIVTAILLFLLTSQQEAYSKLISYVAALLAGVPMILKLFSFFDKTSEKK
jgi:hypothetical protein